MRSTRGKMRIEMRGQTLAIEADLASAKVENLMRLDSSRQNKAERAPSP